MSAITERQRILHLRVLALAGIRTGYEPHQEAIARLRARPITKLGSCEDEINHLIRRYRRQIRPELVPVDAARGAVPEELRL